MYLGNLATSPRKARALFEQACSDGSAHGCEQLALQLGAREHRRVAELHHRACAGDDLPGCQRSGELRAARGDRAGAAVELARACDLGDAASCDRAGGLTSEPARARELFTRACDAEVASGCAHLADYVATGKGGARNWGEGLDLAERGCQLAKATRCAHVARLRAHPPDATCTTAAACQPLCDERIGASCRALAERVAPALRPELYVRACRSGDGRSCAVMADAEPWIDDAQTWWAEGCAHGDARSCTYARFAAARAGSRIDRDVLRRACATDVQACIVLGLALESSDLRAAERLWRDACQRRPGAACRFAAHGTRQDNTGLCWRRDDARGDHACLAETERLVKLACDAGDQVACRELQPQPFDPDAPVEPLELPSKEPRWNG